MPKRYIKVVVGRCEPLVRRRISQALGEDPRIRVLASDLQDAELELAVAQQAPKVAILDETVDISLLVRMKASQLATGVVVLVDAPPRLYEGFLLGAGVWWLARSASAVEILGVVKRAARDERVPNPESQDADAPALEGIDLLSPQELKVFELTLADKTYPQIAAALEISESTAKTHGDRVRQKLNVKSKRELRRRYLDSGR